MPKFTAVVRVVYCEHWSVEADNIDEAKKLFNSGSDKIVEGPGEAVDCEVYQVTEDGE